VDKNTYTKHKTRIQQCNNLRKEAGIERSGKLSTKSEEIGIFKWSLLTVYPLLIKLVPRQWIASHTILYCDI